MFMLGPVRENQFNLFNSRVVYVANTLFFVFAPVVENLASVTESYMKYLSIDLGLTLLVVGMPLLIN